MNLTFYSIVFGLWITTGESFFFLAEKNEPIWFCFKVCPLYCAQRRHDLEDAPSFYWDDEYGTIIHEEPESFVPYHYFCKPPKHKTTTTTPQPTTTMATTTEEPTWICMTCKKKCGNLKNK